MKSQVVLRRSGMTLLEVLIVVAILAVIAGALLVAYDGLDAQAGHGVDAYNSGGLDRAVRSFKVMNGVYPNGLDSLLVNAADPVDIAKFDRLEEHAEHPLSVATLLPGESAALARLGVTVVRDINSLAPSLYTNDGNFANDAMLTASPSNAFDDPAIGGVGVVRALATGGRIAMIDFTETEGAELLRKLRINPASLPRVVVLGLGNNASIVGPNVRGGMASAPFGNATKGRYGRFLLCFQVADSSGVFPEASFVGVLDHHGHVMEDAYKEYKGQ